MDNSQNHTLKLDLLDYFNNPKYSRQKQYEAVRAVIVEQESVETVAKKFGYKVSTIYSIIRDAKDKVIELFPIIKKGPQQKRTSYESIGKIIEYRRKGLSVSDIHNCLINKDLINLSERTIERTLKEYGFSKLKRRKKNEVGKTVNNKEIPERSLNLDFSELKPFNIDSPIAGIFFFIPYIIESGILDIVKKCKLPESSDIGSIQACLSMLFLKLIGGKRLSHMEKYDQEQSFGLFADLNVLPKSTYMSTYSCGCSESQLMELQSEILASFRKKYPEFYISEYINLDFHSIPHFGDEADLEKIWCGAKGKTIKGANTVFAQDSKSNAILYTRADILRKEETNEVKKFIEYWKNIKGDITETLVFDCKFTNYKVLDSLENEDIKFITLRKRSAGLIEKTIKIPKLEWKRVNIPIPKRKYKKVSVHESTVKLSGCKNFFRQIAVKDHGRPNPTFILTNDKKIELKRILEVYAKRWHIENKIAELVAFFNLNALSSPVMIRIHFDILWTVIADTLYHLFAKDLRRFEKILAPKIFRRFIDMPGRVIYNGEKFIIKIRKRSHTPILKGVKKLQEPFHVPWLNNKIMEIIWTS